MSSVRRPVYSVTSLAVYRECPWQYYIQFVRRRPPPASPARTRGTSLHKAIADHLRQPALIPPEVPPADRALFDTFLASRFNRAPALCEAPFELGFTDGTVRGRIDSVFSEDEIRLEIVDYKTGRTRSLLQLADDIQLPIYAMAMAQRFDLEAPDLSWTYLFLRDGSEVRFAGSVAIFDRFRAIVDDLIASIQENKFSSAPGCTCWACTRWPRY